MCNIVAKEYGRLLERMRSRAGDYSIQNGDSRLLAEAADAIEALEMKLNEDRVFESMRSSGITGMARG